MTLVHHHQIEETGGELFVDILLLFGATDGLIEGEVDLVGLLDGAVGDLGYRRTEGLEVINLGLIDQDVALGEEEDAFFAAGSLQLPDDLEGAVGLAGTGGHYQQDALLPPGDGLDDGDRDVGFVIEDI